MSTPAGAPAPTPENPSGAPAPEPQPTETPPAAPEPSPEPNPAPEGAAAAVPPGTEVTTPTYEPNFMFKVHGQEREFDDWAKGLVKTQEDEAKFRDIMEKVYGIDHIKQDRESLRTQIEQTYTPMQQELTTMNQNIATLEKFVQNGNFDAFFNRLQIPAQQIVDWAAKRVQYEEMTPEQRAEYDRQVQTGEQAVYMGQQNQSLQAQTEQLQYDRRMWELDQHIATPQVMTVAQEYDQRMGPGAFREAVQKFAQYEYTTSQKDLTVAQATEGFMRMAGIMAPSQEPTQQMPAQPGQQTPPPQAQPQAPEKKPVIPQKNGSGLSPTANPPKSIADLRKLSEARSGM